jgi:hypothetical protein
MAFLGAVVSHRPPTAIDSTGAHSGTFLCDGHARMVGNTTMLAARGTLFQWLSGRMMRVLFVAMAVVGLIGFASMVAFVLR